MHEKTAEQLEAERKPPRRRWWLLAVGLPILLAGFAANHLEYRHRQKRLRAAADAGALVVRAERSAAGHSQIGIDEASLGRGQERPFLRFAMLGEWAFDPQQPPPCPEAITALSGREASCVGFMYPLEAGTKLRLFCLLRTTQTCCYGPRPQYNQYLFVELREPVKFERFAPVTVTGRFFVDPQPEQGYIYRMEGTSVASAAGAEPELDGAGAARQAGLPLFDFTSLGEMEKARDRLKAPPAVPEALRSLDSKPVVMEGFILNREEGPAPSLVLARDWWDGRSQGRPPTIFSSVRVALRAGQRLPPAWKQKGAFIGTLCVTPDAAAWRETGVVSLREAAPAGAAPAGAAQESKALRLDSGPFLPLYGEALILGALLFVAVRMAWPQPAPRRTGETPSGGMLK